LQVVLIGLLLMGVLLLRPKGLIGERLIASQQVPTRPKR
jgi:ABC-type branched-subunit amino acid transport system permease subunit